MTDVRRATEGDVELANNPSAWPRWPVLPLKRATDSWPELGFIVEVGTRSTVYLHAMYDLDRLEGENLTEKMTHVKKKVYVTQDEMFNDGWIVD